MPAIDSAAMTDAMARLDALRRAASRLDAEAADARNEAADAAGRCREIAIRIAVAFRRRVSSEWVATKRLCEQQQDLLTAFAKIGGVLFPPDEQADLLEQYDRRKFMISEDPQMLERCNFNDYLDQQVVIQEKRLLDWIRRLMTDADASLDLEGLPQ
jgi:hypothetical protein